MTRMSAWLVVFAMISALIAGPVGCESMKGHERTAVGAGVGAATGALAGGIIGHQSGHKGAGAAIGAATGALIGGGIGYALDRRAAARLEQIPDVNVQVNETAPSPEEGQPPVPKRMTLRISNDVLFERGSSALSPAGEAKIGEVANVIKDYPDTSVAVRGYASSDGSDEANMALSQRRADVVAATLEKYRVSRQRIVSVSGLGESSPIASNETESGRAQNRRVEIEVFPTAEMQ
ncbi:OmpA family protein [bacterium]|nr:OmpA family protein [bacterium]